MNHCKLLPLQLNKLALVQTNPRLPHFSKQPACFCTKDQIHIGEIHGASNSFPHVQSHKLTTKQRDYYTENTIKMNLGPYAILTSCISTAINPVNQKLFEKGETLGHIHSGLAQPANAFRFMNAGQVNVYSTSLKCAAGASIHPQQRERQRQRQTERFYSLLFHL